MIIAFRKSLIGALSIAALQACSEPAAPGADKVLTDGAVYTVDDDRSWAEAVAITDPVAEFIEAEVPLTVMDGRTVFSADGI